MPMVDFKRLKEQITVAKLLDHYHWEAKWRRGEQRRGPCILTSGSRGRGRSFAANQHGWYCHHCKQGGDVVRLFCLLHNVAPYEAALHLCEIFGLPVPIFVLAENAGTEKRNGYHPWSKR